MNDHNATTMLQLRSLIKRNAELILSLDEVPMPEPGPQDVLVQMQAAPLNPSDLGLLFGAADLSTLSASGSSQRPVIRATVPEKLMPGMAARLELSMPVGNEGAGLVVKAGASAEAQALLGKTVALLGGGMYSQYRSIGAAQCLVLPAGSRAVDGASCFVNPLTALGMVQTMRLEGHSALVHTVGASNLGQMLNRLCLKDGIALVNIVRTAEQEALLRGQGATWVCNSSLPGFMSELTAALMATGATLAFDAIGGGKLAGQLLSCMEAAASRNATGYSRYGSNTFKQVYIYGGLDRSPTEVTRNFGMTWGMGGWLMFPFLQKIGEVAAQRLRERVLAELKTTFVSDYTQEVSMAQALTLDAIAIYAKQATGAKYLLNPSRPA